MILKECGFGWYGESCSRPCLGHCRDGSTCNHVNGQCARGCDSGWKGYKCDRGSLDNAKIHATFKIQTYYRIVVSVIIYPTSTKFKDQLHLYEQSLFKKYMSTYLQMFLKGDLYAHVCST